MRTTIARPLITLGVMVAVIAPVAGTATAVAVTPADPRDGKLVQVGPVAEHGFPSWYRDSRGVRLEACTTLDDPLCSTLADEVPNPDQPVSYPDNFPGEFFYQLAGAALTMTNGVDAEIGMDLEGAWAAEEVKEGDQMVFGRVRIRFDATAGERYRITHPYGIDDIVADDRGVNMTEDIGTTPGAFGQAMNSRIGPFLVWDPAVLPAAPAGYVGNPGIDHKVIGSPYNTNFVRIERLDPATGAVIADMGFTDLFSIQGRHATNAGVDLNQATYTETPDGTTVVEVYATSEPGQAIQITGNPALGFRTTTLRGDRGQYYGRFPVTGEVPPGATVEVVNASDNPPARKTRQLVDVVRVTEACYDADTQTLTVSATSSDQHGATPQLSVTGFGPLTGEPFTGVTAPPATVTVTSSAGGSATMQLIGFGAPFLPAAPVAGATADSRAIIGQTVKLNGSGSTGEIDTYAWSQTAGPAVTLTGGDTANATFVPEERGTYAFTLTVAGPGGTGVPTTVTVDVINARPPRAVAGPNQTVVRGRAVALDGSASVTAESYAWRQVSGPAVTLAGADTAKPTFTYPAHALPAAPGPNRGFNYDNAALVFELTVQNPAGSSSQQVVIRPQAETLSGITARYRTGKTEWRIDGTSSLLAGQRVTVLLGNNLAGQVIGTTTVDATGAFSLRVTNTPPGALRTISIVTSTGGRVLAAPVTVTN
jgi:hypothetical protein